jgi:hypothetical protein
MNADLHMAEDLKNTGKGNLFVIFGEPDIAIHDEPGDLIRVKVNGVDVFDPSNGEVRSDGADGIACWFIDTDYNEEASSSARRISLARTTRTVGDGEQNLARRKEKRRGSRQNRRSFAGKKGWKAGRQGISGEAQVRTVCLGAESSADTREVEISSVW